MQIGTVASWNLTLTILQPSRLSRSNPTAEQNTPAAGVPTIDPAAKKTTNSTGVSPGVLAFLLRLQELGTTYIRGTNGQDRIVGWSNSLVDGRGGNDTIRVWSGSVVDGGAGDDAIQAWSESAVYGGAGNDRIGIWSDSAAHGGDGDDAIRAWSDTTGLRRQWQ